MAKAAQEFAEIWAETLQANRNLRWLTIGLCAALLFLIAHAFQLAWQPPPKPLIIRVDEVGRAEAVNYEALEAQAKPLDATTKYFLHRFITDHYTRRARNGAGPLGQKPPVPRHSAGKRRLRP